MLRKVILAGELGKKYGRNHSFAVATPAEAIRALCANFPGFANDLIKSAERNVAYKVVVDKDPIPDLDYIHNPFSKALRIVPVIGGAKRGGLMAVVIGAALIASAFFLPATPLIAGLGALSPSLSSIAFGIGTSLALGGISQMLAPQPKAQKPFEPPENKPSYSFNGAVNTTLQGQPVPVGYGRLIIGSAVISAGISADEY